MWGWLAYRLLKKVDKVWRLELVVKNLKRQDVEMGARIAELRARIAELENEKTPSQPEQ